MTETDLMKRFEKLERDNRRMKAFALGAVVLAAALGCAYATKPTPTEAKVNQIYLSEKQNAPRPEGIIPETITAHEFDVVDGLGNRRVVIDTHGGHGRVGILDSQGKARETLWVDQYGPGLWLYDAQGEVRASINLTKGWPEIFFYDANGKEHEAMYLNSDGSPTISLTDAQGFKLLLGSAVAVMQNTDDKTQTSADSVIMLGNDKKHDVIWQAP